MDTKPEPLTPIQLAYMLCKQNHLYFVTVTENSREAYVLYRDVPGRERGVRLGRSGSASGLLRLVRQFTRKEIA